VVRKRKEEEKKQDEEEEVGGEGEGEVEEEDQKKEKKKKKRKRKRKREGEEKEKVQKKEKKEVKEKEKKKSRENEKEKELDNIQPQHSPAQATAPAPAPSQLITVLSPSPSPSPSPSSSQSSLHQHHLRRQPSLSQTQPQAPPLKRRDGENYISARLRCSGAITAESRIGEGYGLPCGNLRSCLADATYNAFLTLTTTLDPTATLSLTKLRRAAIPLLGNTPSASWESVSRALEEQDAPCRLKESTADFSRLGGLMLNLLRAAAGVFVVTAVVTVRGEANRHAICVSTVSEPHCPHGKLIDNYSTMKPVYMEAIDRQHKPSARTAFQRLFTQRVGHEDFHVQLAEIFELVAV
jgi:hypothetical protein